MKVLTRVFVIGTALMLVLTGCAKLPQQEIDNAKAAIDAAITAGAETYTADEIKKLNDDYTVTVEEANKVAGKMFKSTSAIKEKLVQIKTDAEALVTTVAAKKEEAKNNAINALNDAKTAVEEAKTLLTQAPKGKGSAADIEAFTNDLTTAEGEYAGVQQAIDSEDFLGAVEKATAIKEKATGISDEIKKAIEAKGKK